MNAAAASKSAAEATMQLLSRHGLPITLCVVTFLWMVLPQAETQRKFVEQSMRIQETQAQTLAHMESLMSDVQRQHADFRVEFIAAQKQHAEQTEAHNALLSSVRKLLKDDQPN